MAYKPSPMAEGSVVRFKAEAASIKEFSFAIDRHWLSLQGTEAELSTNARIIRRQDYIAMPWKNGGGETLEIARSSGEGSPYLWRLSQARVALNGPFSKFPGYDRWLVVIAGEGLRLNEREVEPFDVLHFRGEESIDALVPLGPVDDLGLIYDRTRVSAQMRILEFGTDAADVLPQGHAIHFLFCITGSVMIDGLSIAARETWQGYGELPRRLQGFGRAVLISLTES